MNVAELVREHRERTRAVLPGVRVELTGSALVVVDAGARDIDLVVVVDDVSRASRALGAIYEPLHADEWRQDRAALRERERIVAALEKPMA